MVVYQSMTLCLWGEALREGVGGSGTRPVVSEGIEDVSCGVTGHAAVSQLHWGVDGGAKKSFGSPPEGARAAFPEETNLLIVSPQSAAWPLCRELMSNARRLLMPLPRGPVLK